MFHFSYALDEKNATLNTNKRRVCTFCNLDLSYTYNNSFTYLGGIFKNLQKVLIIMLPWNLLYLIMPKIPESHILSTLPIYCSKI